MYVLALPPFFFAQGKAKNKVGFAFQQNQKLCNEMGKKSRGSMKQFLV